MITYYNWRRQDAELWRSGHQ